MAFAEMRLGASNAATNQEMSAVERKEAAILEQIKAQGAHIAKATKNAYRPVFAAFKVPCINMK